MITSCQSPRLGRREKRRLRDLEANLQERSVHFLGYPCNLAFDYRPLLRFLRYSLNNVGDPFAPSNYHLNTKDFEREVIAELARLCGSPKHNTWGYVTNGGTEGNLCGLLLARDRHPGGVVFHSADAHYSIHKSAHLLGLPRVEIRSHEDGTVDLADLRARLVERPGVAAIVVANVGTTMKGAIDDVAGIRRLLADLDVKRWHLHADAALSGMILPFVDDAPAWNFRAGVDSINVNGHKVIGSPIPCGIVLARRELVAAAGREVEYVGSLDTTITGSRNGITPLFLWYALRTLGDAGFRHLVSVALQHADDLIARLQANGLSAWRHRHSLLVVIDRPSAAVAHKWQIAVHGDLAHVCVMPHVSQTQLDELVNDLSSSRG